MIQNSIPNVINYVDDVLQLCPIGTSEDPNSDSETEPKGAMLSEKELLHLNILHEQMQKEIENSMQHIEKEEQLATIHISEQLVRNFAKCCRVDDFQFELPQIVQELEESLNTHTAGSTDVINMSPTPDAADSIFKYLKG